MFRIFLFCLVSSQTLFAAEAFHVMTCERVPFGSPVKITTKKNMFSVETSKGKFSLPMDSCKFSSSQTGKFSCKSEGRSIHNHFFVKHSTDVMQIVVSGFNSEKLHFGDFILEDGNSEGFSYRSECMVDNEYLYVK